MKKLAEDQVEAFDTDYVEGNRWTVLKGLIDRHFGDGEWTFLDVGGGTGRMADLLLATYPRARGTVLDNSEVLLDRNIAHDRKTIVCDSAERIATMGHRYDVVCLHWLLHHLVGETYRQTRQNQQALLATVPDLLTARGRLSIFENNYDGWLIDALPGYLVHAVTSIRSISGITRRMGANTAGVGVGFRSRTQWLRALARSGLAVLSYAEPDGWPWPLRLEWKVLLHLRRIRVAHYWVGRAPAPPLV